MPTISGLKPSPAMAGIAAMRVTAAANRATKRIPLSWPRVEDDPAGVAAAVR
jgi:hypothetical protein